MCNARPSTGPPLAERPGYPPELDAFVPRGLPRPNLQLDLPNIARDPKLTDQIVAAVRRVPTRHSLECGDPREPQALRPRSAHLVLTSPPYWTLKRYRDHPDRMGHIADYRRFLDQLDVVWSRCFDALVPGGRLVCVVGDVCLSRRANGGRHTVVPLHAAIQERCRAIGFDNLAPIIWQKIANARYETQGQGAGFLGRPYEPNAIIKNDIEFILMQRKPGRYRTPSPAQRVLSVIPAADHRRWFQQIWTGLPGASTRDHPAPYPLELAKRLVRMFSFVGDTVLIRSWAPAPRASPPRGGGDTATESNSTLPISRKHAGGFALRRRSCLVWQASRCFAAPDQHPPVRF